MPLGERRVRLATGVLLSSAVLFTRLPFISRMLFEFDSIDFAVATFRFNLEQVTPHFPGYILHILFAKLLLCVTSDVNLAFVWISILLSVGSVLFLWRAGALLRGERVGLIVGVLWLFTPIIWYHGEVASVYVYEAFFSSAFLYLGFRLFRYPDKQLIVYALCITLSLACGARQSSILFFAPSLIYLFWKTRQPLRVWLLGIVSFTLVTALWLGLLFHYSGGWGAYFAQAGKETVFRSQSILFGNSAAVQAKIALKVVSELIFSSLPILLVAVLAVLFYWGRTVEFMRSTFSRPTARYALLIALPAFLFYVGIYFMKAGYLLNIMPVIILSGGVLLDQFVIWRAESIRKGSANKTSFTRPIITRGAILFSAVIVLADLGLFFIPFPGTQVGEYNDSLSRDSYNSGQPVSRGFKVVNRLFSFSTLSGVRNVDESLAMIYDTLRQALVDSKDVVLIDTWWHRWSYYYLPQAVTYDIRDFPGSDSLWIGRSNHYFRRVIEDRTIIIPSGKEVLLLLRKDHPSFASITKQVHLARIGLPEYLDIYRITDEHFSFNWKDVRFVKE